MLELDDVAYSYQAGTPFEATALRGARLRLARGELLALVGPTRSGKSTLAQLCNGLLSPSSGSVTVAGAPVAGERGRAHARRTVGLVLQYPEAQLFADSVAEDVAFGPRNFGVSDVDEAVDGALHAVGLEPEHYRHRAPGMLSGGQRRRVAIAGVLACRPAYLVVDEPTAGLDPDGRAVLLDLFAGLARQGMGVLLVSTGLAGSAGHADRVAVLENGTVTAWGKPAEVLADAELVERTGIGRPSTWEIMETLARNGFPVRPGVYAPEAAAEAIAAAVRWTEGSVSP